VLPLRTLTSLRAVQEFKEHVDAQRRAHAQWEERLARLLGGVSMLQSPFRPPIGSTPATAAATPLR